MLQRLTNPSNAGLARFWFDAVVLDPEWFEKRLDEAIKTAGPRYTPEANVDLPIMQDFDAFGRTPSWVKRLKGCASQIAKVSRLASYDSNKLGVLEAEVERVLQAAGIVISLVREITVEPTSPLSFTGILNQINSARSAIASVSEKLSKNERLEDAKGKDAEANSYRENAFRSSRYRLHDVDRALGESFEIFRHTEELAQSHILILDGMAGMGKTHFLCDLARKRQSAHLPTILLMGQRFLQAGEPWTQVLQQLDLVRWSAEEFIGALEAIAQTQNARALLMIDAINEGAGRSIWPSHMSAFLHLATQSPWISVVVSVRTNYEDAVLPSEVMESSARVTHNGFTEHEYDASKTFFKHYGIETPSTPLLAPEYRNPLFLKSICVGLKDEGHSRLPRGFHGISQVFSLYTNAINRRLAHSLDFDPRLHLVHKALQTVVSAFPSHRTQWLGREDAIKLVDAILPNRSYQSSLYQGLVAEGLLVEGFIRLEDGDKEFVHLGYERLADHLTAQTILEATRQGPDAQVPEVLRLSKQVKQLSSGVLESLFIQSPEMLGKELMEYAPAVLSHWRWTDTYRQSLVWRAPSAFNDKTRGWFNKSIQSDSDDLDALEVVLTLASIPGHPWNAHFLERQLRRRPMADRDVWWSIKLHHLYAEPQSAVHRIIDWALTVTASDILDQDSVQLVSRTLGWMFSSSNRFLRDRATKAAVNLLLGREALAADFIRNFADVDDLYIRERVMAVAYGVAMCTSDVARIQVLADAVFETVFATVPVVPHFPLRDYARGVIERLHALSPQTEETMRRVRPPYGSKWPRIPSAEAIKRLEDELKAKGKDAHGARRIIWSVLHDDFGRYVIGTNSSATDWLSIRLHKPVWRSYADRLQEFESEFPELQPAWEMHREADSKLALYVAQKRVADLRMVPGRGSESADIEALERDIKAALKTSERILLELLTVEQASKLKELWKSKPSSSWDGPPKFDLRLMQRYIVKRVFSLGWTSERFEFFDSHVVPYNGRKAAKAERVGKKYQWIAYHEVCALVADNFQFRNDMGRENIESFYDGPWQDFFRDIDPSHAILKTGGDSGSNAGWWAPRFEPDWGEDIDGLAWVQDVEDFPDVPGLLKKTDNDGHAWLVADISFDQARPTPEGMDRYDTESRTFWCHLRSFLIRNEDVDAFMQWAEGVDFFGQWMPKVPTSHAMFLGEYGWSPAWKHFDNAYYEQDGWVQPEHGCPVKICISSFEYHQESSSFDCSVDAAFTLHLPDVELQRAMNLTGSGYASEFIDSTGQVSVKDPSAKDKGPAALVIREALLEEMARDKGLSICWMIVGEKQAYLPGPLERVGATHISGACTLRQGRINGFVNFIEGTPHQRKQQGRILAQKRIC